MHFLRSPVEAIADDLGRVAGLRLEKMSLQEVDGRQTAVPTGSFETLRVMHRLTPGIDAHFICKAQTSFTASIHFTDDERLRSS